MRTAFLFSILCSVVLCTISGLRPEVNLQFQYKIEAKLKSMGSDSLFQVNTDVTESTFTAGLVATCYESNDTHASFSAFIDIPIVSNGLSTQKLYSVLNPYMGADFSYVQKYDGSIVKVSLSAKDPANYTQIKLGVINALNTRVISAGKTDRYVDVDVVGSHSTGVSSVIAKLGSFVGLGIRKIFSHSDVTQYADPKVQPGTFKMNAVGESVIHPKGYIHTSSFDQNVTMSHNRKTKASAKISAVDLSPSALGTLKLTLKQEPEVIDPNPNRKRKMKSEDMLTGNLMDVSRHVTQRLVVDRAEAHDTERALNMFFGSERHDDKLAHQISNVMSVVPSKIKLMSSFIKDGSLEDKLRSLYILSTIYNQPEAEEIFVSHGLQSDDVIVRQHATFLSHHTKSVSERTLKHLYSESEHSDSALLAFGSVLSKLTGVDKHVKNLVHRAKNDKRFATMGALKNAGITTYYLSDVNITKSVNYSLGGTWVAADVQGDVYIETSTKCNATKKPKMGMSATASLHLQLFQQRMSAMKAQVSYGTDMERKSFVEVWGKVVKSIDLPYVNCLSKTYKMNSWTNGVSYSYTMWTSIIPVFFSAQASLNTEVSYGYSMCVEDLSAKMQLSPQATISVSASMGVDLLLVKSGTALTGSFETTVEPSVFVNNCDIGAQVVQHNRPMSLVFDVFYQWQICKYLWIFSCSTNEQHKIGNYAWDMPASDRTLGKWSLLH